VCVTPDGARAYVSNRDDNSLTVVDLDALSVAATITDPALKSPEGLTVSPDGKRLYVALSGQDAVLVLATDTHKPIKQIPTAGKTPMRLLLSPDGHTLWVANDDSSSVSVIDTTKDVVVATIPTGMRPRGMALTPDGKFLRVANVVSDTITFADAATSKVLGNAGLGHAPQRIVVDPDGQIAYATGRAMGALALIDLRGAYNVSVTRSLPKVIPVGWGPNGLVLNGDGKYMYVGNNHDDTVSIVDVRIGDVVDKVHTGRYPDGMAYRK
jgi:YVTN family beta-propeller protein